MAFTENFDSDTGNYQLSGADATYEAGIGNSAPGCVRLDVTTISVVGSVFNVADSQAIASGDYLYFNYNVVGAPDANAEIRVSLDYADTDTYVINPLSAAGWQQFSQSLAARVGQTLEGVAIELSVDIDGPFDWYVYIDSIKVGNPPPPTLTSGTALPQRRYLGLAADSGKVYLTSITGGSITYYSIPQNILAADGTATFGTAAYTDPDAFTAGLFPVTRPGSDLIVYLYGRDGNSKQVQYNDLNGTLGWVDVGPGTATWGTAKYCVALLADLGQPDDVIAAFYDNDVYRTETGTAAWTKQGDATSNLRTAARHPTTPENLYLAGTAAGTLLHSPNLGVSYGSVGGTVVAGTINAIEVSR